MGIGYLRRQLRRQQKHHHHWQRLQLMLSWSHGSCGSRSKCSHRQEGASCQKKLRQRLQSCHLMKRQQQLQRSRCGGSCHSCHRSSHARTHGCSCRLTHGHSHLQHQWPRLSGPVVNELVGPQRNTCNVALIQANSGQVAVKHCTAWCRLL